MDVISSVIRYGMEFVFKRYYGLYRGTVVDNKDPELRGRVRVRVPAIMDEDPHDDYWFEPALWGAGGGRGSFWPPEPGDSVRVSFDNGDVDTPGIYLGGWFGSPEGKSEVPSALGYGPDGLPEKRGFVTRGGHALVMDDTAEGEAIRLVWHQMAADDPARKDRTLKADITKGKLGVLSFLSDGGFVAQNSVGDTLHMDAATKSVKLIHSPGAGKPACALFLMDNGFKLVAPDGGYLAYEDGTFSVAAAKGINLATAASILLKGNVFLGELAAQGIPLGEALMAWLGTHVHTTTAPGAPTSPPLTAPALAGLTSKKAKVG